MWYCSMTSLICQLFQSLLEFILKFFLLKLFASKGFPMLSLPPRALKRSLFTFKTGNLLNLMFPWCKPCTFNGSGCIDFPSPLEQLLQHFLSIGACCHHHILQSEGVEPGQQIQILFLRIGLRQLKVRIPGVCDDAIFPS